MKKTFCILLLIMSSAAAFSQEQIRTAYFLDGYDFRHQMNPALASARSYFALPGLGYVNAGVHSNMGVKTFLYPTGNGQLATFMSNSVSSSTFLGNLHKNNLLAADLSTSLFSIGAWGKKNGFTTLELNLKSGVSANIPRDLFSFVKNIGGSQHYDISNFGVRAKAYLELSIGQSQRINERITVGAKLKFLLGAADAKLNIDNMSIDMTKDEWSVRAKGSLRASSGGFINIPSYEESGKSEEGKVPDQINFGGISINDPVAEFRNKGISAFLGGYGAALDLGFSFDILKGLTVSASVLDLGFIRWNNSSYAATDDNYWSFKGFENVSFDENSENHISKQFKKLGEGFEDMIVLHKNGSSKYTEMLATTINAAVQYKMPFWDSMSVGALLTSRIQGAHSWTEGRVSLNFAFGNVFGLSGSYAYSNFGSSFGLAMNLHCRAFSWYLGTDTIPVNFSSPIDLGTDAPIKIKAPIGNLNFGLHCGFVFNVSKRKDKSFR